MIAEGSQRTAPHRDRWWIAAALDILKKDGSLIGAMAAIGAALALMVGQIVLIHISEVRLRAYADEIFKHSVEVATMSIGIFAAVEEPPNPVCSDADLNALRYLLFHKEYLYDIGRKRNGELLCSAGWGRFAAPLKLPQPHRLQPNGDEIWANEKSVVDPRLTVDMAAHGSVVVFTSPTAFKPYEKPDAGFSALVLTHDGAHVYRSFGESGGLAERLAAVPRYEIGPRLTTSECVDEPDICVVAALSGVDILDQSPVVWSGIAGIGGASAGLFALGALLWHRALSSPSQQLRRALADGRLSVAYQPLVRIADGRLIGVEALARLSDERGGMITPDLFIGIAEEAGLIGTIVRTVVRTALSEMEPWLTGAEPFHVSVNLTAADVVDREIHMFLDEMAASRGIQTGRIIVEITERSTTDHERLIEGVKAFRQRGYGVFIDDFGTGHSNLAYLAKLPISGIKIDRVFTQAIGKEAVSSTIVEKICAIAAVLDVELVVEGIETVAQASCIRDLFPGAIGQGWLFGRPTGAETLRVAFPVEPPFRRGSARDRLEARGG